MTFSDLLLGATYVPSGLSLSVYDICGDQSPLCNYLPSYYRYNYNSIGIINIIIFGQTLNLHAEVKSNLLMILFPSEST